jgi:DNA-directed RNA polymerase subunit M/transcription elongation factor TFIIS
MHDCPQSDGALKPKLERLKLFTLQRPKCPRCGSTKLRNYRSISDQGDGSSLSWVRCSCGQRFKVVME